MTSPYDMSGPFTQPTRSPRRRGPVGRLLLLLICATILIMAGVRDVEHAFRNPSSGGDVWLIIVAVIGVLAAVSLVIRIGRGAAPENPLSTTNPIASSIETRSASSAQTQASTQASSMPSSPPPPPLPTGRRSPASDTIASIRRRAIIGGLLMVATITVGLVLSVFSTPDRSVRGVSVPRIGETFNSSTCPRPGSGADPLDSTTTDCTPLDVDDVFEATDTISIQGETYRVLTTAQSSDCATVTESPSLRAYLTAAGCTDALRALYATTDNSSLGAVELLAFTNAATTEQAQRMIEDDQPLTHLTSPDDEAALVPAIDTLEPVNICSVRGRFLSCVSVADSPAATTPLSADGRRMLSHLSFLVADAISARRFASM